MSERRPARQVVVVPMPDGRVYDIVPLGNDRRGPRHRIYQRVSTGPRGTYRHRRVTDEGEQAEVAARLMELRTEARRDIAREKRWGKWLVDRWRWAMVLIDQMRAWWRARRKR